MGVCPAASYEEVGNDLNGGRMGGRICWTIAGTFCGGKKQGTFAQKLANCVICDFFKKVREEEGTSFKITPPTNI